MSGVKTFVSRGPSPFQLAFPIRTFALLVALAVFTTGGALSYAQTFTILHDFTEGPDGSYPYSSPTLEGNGNFYGTTSGAFGPGNVYEMKVVNGSWILNSLFDFRGGDNGGQPSAGVTIGPDGTLFGATPEQGEYGLGTLFQLQPPANVCHAFSCPWTLTTLHAFAGGSDGAGPFGNVIFDSQGNLYGTTNGGGAYHEGTVFEATRSGGTWNISVIHSFDPEGGDGSNPNSGLVVDSAGNLYGTTPAGGAHNDGTVFELSPSGGGWTETILHSFAGGSDGCNTNPGLVFDQAGNLYGATTGGPCLATIFELTPQGSGWSFITIHALIGQPNGPESSLTVDSAGNLYGTNPFAGDSRNGNVFELSPSAGGWTYIDLHDFTGDSGGANPIGGVAVTGPGGYLYGTTAGGGTYNCAGGTDNCGTIYEINLGAH